jgi:translation initiation factor 5
MDDKNDRYIVNGAHDAPKLQQLLDGFIKKFVLCGACENPETDLIVKGDNITKKCMACGKLTPVDMRHKLTTFIVKNPPPDSVKHHSKAQKAVKKRGPGNSSPTSETPGTPTSEAPGGDDDEEDNDAMLREAAQLVVHDDSDGEWSQDVSAAAVAARQKEALVGAIGKLAVGGDDDDEEESLGGENPLDAFGDFVTRETPEDEIFGKAKELGLKDDKALVVLVQVLIDADVATQLPARRGLLAKFLKGKKPVKAQKALLGGIERLVGELYPEQLLAKVPVVLKAVYDLDLVDEEVVLAWGEKASSKYVKKVRVLVFCFGWQELNSLPRFFRTSRKTSGSVPSRS